MRKGHSEELDPEENPVDEVIAKDNGVPPPRKRGRPRGSKTQRRPAGAEPVTPKSTVRIEIPDSIIAMIATAPLMLTSTVARRITGRTLVFSEHSLSMVAGSFKAWLSTLEYELTPGWAVLGAYTFALSEAFAAGGAIEGPSSPNVVPLHTETSHAQSATDLGSDQPAAASGI